MSESARALAKQFEDEEFRRAYAEDFLNASLALQIAVTRRQRGWSQAELAERAGTTQSVISRMEDVNYGNWSVRKLKEVAAALGLALHISLEEFGTLLDNAIRFSEKALRRNGFADDPRIQGLLATSDSQLPAGAGAADIFAHEVSRTLQLPLPERAARLRRWVAGYGLSMAAGETPIYRSVLDALPGDHTFFEQAMRLAEAAAELLRPTEFLQIWQKDGEEPAETLLLLVSGLGRARNILADKLDALLAWTKEKGLPPRLDSALMTALSENQVDERWLDFWGSVANRSAPGSRLDAITGIRKLMESVDRPSKEVGRLVIGFIEEEHCALLKATDRKERHVHLWERALDREKKRIWQVIGQGSELPLGRPRTPREMCGEEGLLLEQQRILYQSAA